MTYEDILGKFKQKLIKFWRSDDSKISLIRDVIVALILVLIILTALWTYTGQWFGAPMVAIESGSMMHQDEPFGRFGTINAGDMVLLRMFRPEKAEVVLPDDFGIEITKENLEDHLRLIRKDRDEYHLAQPKEVAEVEELAEETASKRVRHFINE